MQALQRLMQAAALRGQGVVAKIIAVALTDRLHQRMQLRVRVALGHHMRSIFGIHTRSSEYRRSRSIGLAR